MKPLIKSLVFAVAVLSGCAEPAPLAQDRVRAAAQGHRALFPTYPTELFDAFSVYCTGTTRSFKMKTDGTAQCDDYLPPEPTAKVILRYNGIVSDLPKMIITLQSRETDDGYVVTNRNFLNVPQSDGRAVQVVFANRNTEKQIRDLFRMAGGKPL